jgi:flagellar motor switch protein FliN
VSKVLKPVEEISFYGDVPMDIAVDLDQVVMTLDQVLHLEQGSVIKMNRSAGENISISIGSALVAYGEIVIIEAAMGVRITGFDTED